MSKEFESSLKSISPKYLNYYLSLNENNRYKFYKMWNFNKETSNFIIENINKIEKGKVLLFKTLFKEFCETNFDNILNYKCYNKECEYNTKIIKTKKHIKKCPKCKSNLDLINKTQITNMINYYLQDYDFYLLSEEQESLYLIYDKVTSKYYIKRKDTNFKTFIYHTLKGHNININYLKSIYSEKIEETLLFDYIKDNNLINMIDNLGFKPSQDTFLYEDDKIYFNSYKGNKYLNMKLSDEDLNQLKNFNLSKQCPNIYLLLNNLISNDQEALNYIIKYLSFVLNNPYIRTEKVISFYGEENTGKGIFYSSILEVLFEGYCEFISMKELEEDTFNEHYLNSLFVFVDESYYNKSIEQKMLSLTTAKRTTINKKHGSKKPSNIYFNYICASNKDVPMKVGNRRSVYFRSKTLGGSNNQAGIIGEKLVNCIPNEIDLFAKYLKSLNVQFQEINRGYDNQDKEDINEATKTIEERFLDDMFSYKTLIDFIKQTYNKETYEEAESIYLSNSKDGYIEYNLFLELYNRYRLEKGINIKVSLNKFNWFCNKLDINKNDTTQFTRRYNNNQQNVRWINNNLILKLYEDNNNESD